MLHERDDDEHDVFADDIEEAIREFERTQDGMMLFEAMRRCVQYGKPFPDRVWAPFMAAVERYKTADARTLDEAFGVTRAKNLSSPSAQAKARKARHGISTAGSIYLAVVHRNAKGRAIGEELFQEVAAEHQVSWSTARKYYREVKAQLEDEREADKGHDL